MNSTTTALPLSSVSPGDTAWMLMSTALVFLMIPGLGFFYAGMARSHSALSLIFLSMLALAIVSLEWFLWGYSLSFAPDSTNPFIGNLRHISFFNLHSIDAIHPNAPNVPALVYAIYQSMFAAITPAIAFGAVENRTRVLPCIVFIFLWTSIVYNPVAYWNWAPHGWAKHLGALDFAGGTPVHVVSGMAALAYTLRVGHRSEFNTRQRTDPHNYFYILLGTALLWFGWFGFNGGSAGAANLRACNAIVVTNLSASISALTWTVVSYFRHDKKWSSFGYCGGAVAGLVTITPASGYVAPWAAVIIGICAGIVCNFASDLKYTLNYDDALDVFGVHGVGGMLGCILTGIFAQSSVISLDGSKEQGGWLDGNWMQLPVQLASLTSAAAWSFCLTYIILSLMDLCPPLRLRMDPAQEDMGMDVAELGEDMYGYLKQHKTINVLHEK